ncbi:holin [Acidovorax sp.]|uniref:holin n=1 Tax=Acidovorax sp. TaxID=1872122 RepID=UPI002ACE95B4|nr:holin [Acidovorax sp.]MDZ7863393.1 holin [Acidovorax sp.]
MKDQTVEQLGAAGSKTIMTGVGLTSFSWITSNEFLGLLGATVAVAGLVITWYYKRESNARQVAEHQLRMARLRKGMDSDTDLGTLGADDD